MNDSEGSHRRTDEVYILLTLVVGYFACAQYDVKTRVEYFACARYDAEKQTRETNKFCIPKKQFTKIVIYDTINTNS